MASLIIKKDKLEKGEYWLISGFPGIANVAKITVDYLIDKLNTELVLEAYSPLFPSFVLVSDKYLIETPKIKIYKVEGKDILILTGDSQPDSSIATNRLTLALLELLKNKGVKNILTLGGIGLSYEPEDPKVYIAGTHKTLVNEIAKKSKNIEINKNTNEVVGPIIGLAGTLVGYAPLYKIKGVTLLAETFSHPMYLGINGAYKLVNIIKDVFELDIDTKELEDELRKIREAKEKALKQLQSKFNITKEDVLRYFG